MPGGAMEWGESPLETAVRELEEEPGRDGRLVRSRATVIPSRDHVWMREVTTDSQTQRWLGWETV